eukprot:1142564-Pelagomonas_calceolata.AAC.4
MIDAGKRRKVIAHHVCVIGSQLLKKALASSMHFADCKWMDPESHVTFARTHVRAHTHTYTHNHGGLREAPQGDALTLRDTGLEKLPDWNSAVATRLWRHVRKPCTAPQKV